MDFERGGVRVGVEEREDGEAVEGGDLRELADGVDVDLLQTAGLISFSPSLSLNSFFWVELSLNSDHGLKRSDNKKIKKFV